MTPDPQESECIEYRVCNMHGQCVPQCAQVGQVKSGALRLRPVADLSKRRARPQTSIIVTNEQVPAILQLALGSVSVASSSRSFICHWG